MQQPDVSSSPQQHGPSGLSLRLFSTQLDEMLKVNPFALVMFTSPTCAPCKLMYPLLANLANAQDLVKIAVVDITISPASGTQYHIRSMPTLMLFKNGVPEKTYVGSMNYTKLLAFAGIN